MNFKTFGEWLRHRRLQLDISPFKMSEALGYKRVSAIYNFEYGLAPLPMTKWPSMARILDLSLDEFLCVIEHFSPQKVAEFRAIRAAEPVSTFEERSSRASLSTGHSMPEREPRGSAIASYRLEGAQLAVIFQGSYDEEVSSYLDDLWSSGQRVGVLAVSAFQPFPGISLVEHLKPVSTVGVLESETGMPLSPWVKAAFLDALTGVGGYPHIHRVPKIYACLLREETVSLEPELLRTVLSGLEQGPETRIVRLADRSTIRA